MSTMESTRDVVTTFHVTTRNSDYTVEVSDPDPFGWGGSRTVARVRVTCTRGRYADYGTQTLAGAGLSLGERIQVRRPDGSLWMLSSRVVNVAECVRVDGYPGRGVR